MHTQQMKITRQIIIVLSSLLIFCFLTNKSIAQEAISDQAFSKIRDGSSNAGVIDLNGNWQFKATDESLWLEAHVPGTVWTDLLRVGRVEDPFYRDNELKVQWVERKEWEYRRDFFVDQNFLKHDKIVLDCRGLDTITEIYLNDSLIAQTENMFIEFEFDVKRYLHSGQNQLHIIFRSILNWDKAMVESDSSVIWTSSKGRTFFSRKEASDFGWDWGIRLVTCGIWKSIRLAAYDYGRITDLTVQQNLSDPKIAILNVSAGIENFNKNRFEIDIKNYFEEEIISTYNIPVTDGKATQEIPIENPKLWWPNGWGDQPMYKVEAILKHGDQIVHSKKIKIGLRKVEIVREKDDRGESFGIKVNGQLIFCKGANWIPADALPERLTEANYIHLLSSCKEANMNMLRIWAGGIYEPEIFYEYCDENGIMLWHDFMFAVGPVRGNEEYIKNVHEEISNVVSRLRHHPSIVLWCGNNEIESGMPKWIKMWKTMTWKEYDIIFNHVIPSVVKENDPDRPYWPGSPHHPLNRDKDTDGYEAESGDAHIWDIWHGGQPFSWFVDNVDMRFVSEFGFQSLPPMETIRSFTNSKDRYFASQILDHHNKAGHKPNQNIGNQRIARYTESMYKMPSNLENWVYVSQIMHGEAMKISTEAYRRNYPRTTGALYWQVNDNWPTISGSGLDYYGRWKALQYMAGRFFNPVLVTGWVEGTTVKIWGVNDSLEDMQAKLQWSLYKFDGTEKKHGEKKVMLPANNSILITELDFEKEVGENPEYITYRKDSYENRGKYYLSIKLVQGDKELSSNVLFFIHQKYLQLGDPLIKYEIEKKDGELFVNIISERFAAYVELGLKNSYARFSDNYFHLLPGKTKSLKVLETEVETEEFIKQLYIKSLLNSYR
jgi:beta-mannosidase